jgi:pimeloyl-ACP methyl ester carboxylesterase
MDAGFSVLTFDLRGHGAYDGTFESRAGVTDIADAINYVVSQEGRVVAVLGSELGGTLALAASEPGLFTGCVALSPSAVLPGDENDGSVVRGQVPTLIIVGSDDERSDAWATQLHQACDSWCSCMRVPVADCGLHLLTGKWKEDVLESILRYFSYLEWMATSQERERTGSQSD